MKVQPPVVTKAPDANEVSVIVANTVVSIAACAVVRCCGRYASVKSVVPPI